jgi:hypothetical protein
MFSVPVQSGRIQFEKGNRPINAIYVYNSNDQRSEILSHVSVLGDRTIMIFRLTGVFATITLRWVSGISIHYILIVSSNMPILPISDATF